MTPENRNPHINIKRIRHTGNLEGDFQELPHTEGAPSIRDVDTGEIEQIMPQTSGELTLTDDERGPFQDKLATQRAYHEQRTARSSESHKGRNIAIGTTSLLLVGGAVAGVTALNQPSSTPPEANPSASGVPIPGQSESAAPLSTLETTPSASPSNITPLETATPTPSASEINPGALNEFGITTSEYGRVKNSLTINADTYKTPEEVTGAFMNVIDAYYAGGHSSEVVDAHYDDNTPDGKVGWNAWSNELYTKAIKETVFTPTAIERVDSPIPNLIENKRIANRLWANSERAGGKKYEITTTFTVENVSTSSENGFTVIGTQTRSDNSAEVPIVASDSASIKEDMISENVKIAFIKADGQWRVASYVTAG